MSEMVERVARAILHAYADDKWEDLDTHWHEVYLNEARAAIEAMREPTQGMIDATDDFDWGPSGYFDAPLGSAYPDKVWRAMINAALKEPAHT